MDIDGLGDKLIEQFSFKDWIKLYIYWEVSLIKELGFEIDFLDRKKYSFSVLFLN